MYATGTLHVDGDLWVWEKFRVNDYNFPETDGDANQVMITDGAGNLTWTAIQDVNGTGLIGHYIEFDTNIGIGYYDANEELVIGDIGAIK